MRLTKRILALFLFFIVLNQGRSVLAVEDLKKYDFNNDFTIDNKDLDEINKRYNMTVNDNSSESRFDLNNDKIVDVYDVVQVAGNFGNNVIDKPNIIDPFLTFDFGSEGPLPNKPIALVLHHAEASKASVYDVHRWHKEAPRHWAGIGYHFYIRKDGTIYKGREENWRGAHAPAYNDKSLGICVEGAYSRENMPQVQKDAVIKLGKYLVQKYNMHEVYKHQDVTATNCPGEKYPFTEIKKSILDLHV